ncbi:DUF6883 domain-containing protein [Thermomonas brevis]
MPLQAVGMGHRPSAIYLPECDRLHIERAKIVDYLLSDGNGRGKAGFFRRLGFHSDRWEELADALRHQASSNPVCSQFDSPYGTRYVVEGSLLSPDGRWPPARIATVWLLESATSQRPRLITAFPA